MVVLSNLDAYSADLAAEDVTPEFLAEKTLGKLKGRPANLDTVRNLGPTFDSSCLYVLSELRCRFWLWEKEKDIYKDTDIRGIELRFLASQDWKVQAVEGLYIYDRLRRGATSE
jgi:hypothetical protein